MSSTTVKLVSKNGDERTWVVRISNLSNLVCHNSQFAITVPNGILLTGPAIQNSTQIQVPIGTFNPLTKIWYIGTMGANQILDTSFIFKVNDIEEQDPVEKWFQINGVLTSSCNELVTQDNTIHFVLRTVEACDLIDLSAGPDDAEQCCNDDLNLSVGE